MLIVALIAVLPVFSVALGEAARFVGAWGESLVPRTSPAHSQNFTSGAIVRGAGNSRSRRHPGDRSLSRSGVIPVARPVCELNRAAVGRWQTSVPLRFARPDWRVGRA